ncbi:MAG: PorT family protein [Tannerella sp.]|jgi:hypothetical protein|nr:PorT family protein [Tannerella sp.]
MKKVILVTIIALTMSLHSYAQFTIGPKAGLNLSTVHSTKVDDYADYKTGLNAGFFGKYSINNSFDLQVELLYAQLGYKDNMPTFDYDGSGFENFNYKLIAHNLDVPLLVKYNLLGRPWIFFEGGVQLGFSLSNKYSCNDKDVERAMNELKPEFNTFDFQLLGGLGFYLGSGFSVNARYCHGLTDMMDSGLHMRNRAFQFSLAYNLWQF